MVTWTRVNELLDRMTQTHEKEVDFLRSQNRHLEETILRMKREQNFDVPHAVSGVPEGPKLPDVVLAAIEDMAGSGTREYDELWNLAFDKLESGTPEDEVIRRIVNGQDPRQFM